MKKCDCGAEKVGSTHYEWCSINKPDEDTETNPTPNLELDLSNIQNRGNIIWTDDGFIDLDEILVKNSSRYKN